MSFVNSFAVMLRGRSATTQTSFMDENVIHAHLHCIATFIASGSEDILSTVVANGTVAVTTIVASGSKINAKIFVLLQSFALLKKTLVFCKDTTL